MTTTQEATAETGRLEFMRDFADDVAAVDDLVEQIKRSPHNWLPARAIRRWGEVTQKTLEEYSGTGVSDPTINLANAILKTGIVDGERIDVEHNPARLPGSPDAKVEPIDAVTAYNRRLFFAHLLLSAPDDFAVLQERKVFAFHGTKGVVLQSLINQGGLLSHATLHERDVPIGTGEPNPEDVRRDFVSFSSITDRAAITHSQMHLLAEDRNLFHLYPGYELRGKELEEYRKFIRERIAYGNNYMKIADSARFGILVGLSQQALWMNGIDPELGERVDATTSFPEYSFKDQVPTHYLPVIAAPAHQKDIERYMLKRNLDIAIISSKPIERVQDLMRRPI